MIPDRPLFTDTPFTTEQIIGIIPHLQSHVAILTRSLGAYRAENSTWQAAMSAALACFKQPLDPNNTKARETNLCICFQRASALLVPHYRQVAPTEDRSLAGKWALDTARIIAVAYTWNELSPCLDPPNPFFDLLPFLYDGALTVNLKRLLRKNQPPMPLVIAHFPLSSGQLACIGVSMDSLEPQIVNHHNWHEPCTNHSPEHFPAGFMVK